MPLSLTSISRVNGSACNHFNIGFNIDGATSSATLSRAEVENLMEGLSPLPGNYKHLLLVLLTRYRLEQGTPLNLLAASVTIP